VRKHWEKYLGVLVTGIVLWSLPVQAAIPAECEGSFLNKRAYNTGVVLGQSIVSQAWNGIEEDCDRLEEFETVIVNNVMDYVLPPEASQFTLCRYYGHIEGMLMQIDLNYTECGDKCAEEGHLIGEISAIAYCQLSFALEGLATADDFVRLPVQFCGTVFQISCDLNYNTVTRTYVDDGWDNPATTDVHEGMCVRYTDQGNVLDPETGEPMWEPVWKQVRDIQCAYFEPDKEDE
jgi:hypothetical protein